MFQVKLKSKYEVTSSVISALKSEAEKLIKDPTFFSLWKEKNQNEFLERTSDADLKADGIVTDADWRDKVIYDKYGDFIEYNLDDAEEDGGQLLVYRCVKVPSIDRFVEGLRSGKHPNVGIYWSTKLEEATCHWGEQSGEEVALFGKVKLNAINITETLIAGTSYFWDEAEITMKPGAAIELEKLTTGPRSKERIENLGITVKA